MGANTKYETEILKKKSWMCFDTTSYSVRIYESTFSFTEDTDTVYTYSILEFKGVQHVGYGVLFVGGIYSGE
jgi:hypothetical protein